MMVSKTASFLWKILLILIFLRPFISEYTFLTLGFWYVSILFISLIFYLILSNGIGLLSSSLNFFVFLFIITILISIIFSGFTKWSLFELYLFIPNVLIFYVVSKIKPGQQKQLIATIFFAASIISIYAIYQYFIGFRHVLEYIKQTYPNRYIEELLVLNRKRVFATFISPNIFASYIVMMLFLGMGFLITAYYQRKKLIPWLYISIFTMIISLLFTKSLGGSLSFVMIILLFLFLVIFYLLPKFEFKKIILKRIELGIIFGLVVFAVISILFTRHRLLQLVNLKDPNNSIIQRFYYWIASLNMARGYLLTGRGWRKFGLLYEFYKLPPANISHYSHNIFLQIIAETGLLGLLSFLSIVVIFLRNGLNNIKNNNEQQGLKIGLFCAGCAFLFHNLIDLSFYFSQVSFFWWLILGLFTEKTPGAI